MIGRLKGTVVEIDPQDGMLLLDVTGPGYEVEVAASVMAASPQAGSQMTLHTHLVVREDAQLLYGFSTRAERDLFRGYIRINGVGPKLGLSLISALDSGTLAMAVRNNDVSVLTRVPGIGKKTAERLMVELKNRVDSLGQELKAGISAIQVGGDIVSNPSRKAVQEAEDALVALGYKPAEASRAVAGVLAGDVAHSVADNVADAEHFSGDVSGDEAPAASAQPLSTEEIVRLALRSFAHARTRG